MMFLVVSVALSLASFTVADVVNTTTCANQTTYVDNFEMDVSECTAEDEYCNLYRGHVHTVVFRFTPTIEFPHDTKFKVHGIMKDLPVPYGRSVKSCANTTIDNSNETCHSLGGFKPGNEFIYTIPFKISTTYPKMQLKVRFSKVDKRKNYLFCEEVKVSIVDPVENATTATTTTGAPTETTTELSDIEIEE